MSHVHFVLRPYVASHMKDPRGRGSWAFGTKPDADVMVKDEIMWSPHGTFADAKKWARAQALARKIDTLYVLP